MKCTRNGVAINPMTMKLPSGRVLKGDELEAYRLLYASTQGELRESSIFEEARLAEVRTATTVSASSR